MQLANARKWLLIAALSLLIALTGTFAFSQQFGGDWQPVGSYSILTQTGRPTSRTLQLSIDARGRLRGTFRDPVSDTAQRLRGNIDPNSEQVRWSFDTNPMFTFRTTLADLTSTKGTVEVTGPGGQRELWKISRQQ